MLSLIIFIIGMIIALLFGVFISNLWAVIIAVITVIIVAFFFLFGESEGESVTEGMGSVIEKMKSIKDKCL